MKIACLQTEPKSSIKEALDEALDLASLAKSEDVNFLFLPEYCGGISSNGKLYTPPSDEENKHLFLQELRSFCKKNSVWCLIGSIAIKVDNNKIKILGFTFPTRKVVSATGFEPVILACKPLKTLNLFLGTDFNRFINNPLLTRILCIANL